MRTTLQHEEVRGRIPDVMPAMIRGGGKEHAERRSLSNESVEKPQGRLMDHHIPHKKAGSRCRIGPSVKGRLTYSTDSTSA